MTTTQRTTRPAGIAAPTGLAASAVASGGTFGAGAQFWKITFVTTAGESAPSNEATATLVSTGSANLTWTQPPAGVLAVNIYRGTTTNTENKLIVSLSAQSLSAPAAYTDTGTAGTTQSPPSAPAGFANLTLDSSARTSPADTLIAALDARDQAQALQAANTWHNCAGVGDLATAAQKEAAALGFVLQDV